MTTELTDEQIREAAMKASRLEVERAPIASTELSDEKLIADARKYEFAEWGMNGALHRLADRLAERNATLVRVQERLDKWSKSEYPQFRNVASQLRKILAPAQKEAVVEVDEYLCAKHHHGENCPKCGHLKCNHITHACCLAQPASPDAAPDAQREACERLSRELQIDTEHNRAWMVASVEDIRTILAAAKAGERR